MKSRVVALLAAPVVAACGRTPPALPDPVAERCALLTAAGPPPDTLIVGVAGTVARDHAPVPTTRAERLVFAHFYETLLTVNCQDRPLPALAERWSVTEGGRRVSFTLRDGARFWDGAPVTAQDVLASWADHEWLVSSAASPDPRTVSAWLARLDPDVARLFADPRLSVTRPGKEASGPVGTGALRPVEWTSTRIVATPPGRERPVIVFRTEVGADPRDLLESGTDLVMTDDPATLEYARGHPGLDVVPLPWGRTYVLAGAGFGALTGGDSLAALVVSAAVRAEVRAAEPPFWWTSVDVCADSPLLGTTVPSGPAMRRIAYAAGDPIAQDLAGRIVALAAAGRALGGGQVRAVGMRPEAFDSALFVGSEFAFVTAISKQSHPACVPAALKRSVPLLDARSSVVLRRGRVGVAVGWDAVPRLLFQP